MSGSRAQENLIKARNLLQSAIVNCPAVHPDYPFFLGEIFLELSKLSEKPEANEILALYHYQFACERFSELHAKVSFFFVGVFGRPFF
jgi:hypothetical protein